MIKKSNNQIPGLIISIILLAAILIYKNFAIEYVTFTMTFLVCIIGFYIYSNFKNNKPGVQHDELSNITDLKSIRNSWLSTYFMISAISLLDFFNIKHFSLSGIIFILIMGMNITLFVSKFVYRKKLEN